MSDSRPTSNPRTPSPETLGLAFLLAIYFALTVPASPRLSPAYDEPIHIRAGIAALTGGRYVDATKAWWTALDPMAPPIDAIPGAVALLAGQTPDFRADPFPAFAAVRAARVVNHVLGALTVILVFLWARAVWRSEAAGLASAGMAALHPLFLAHTTIVSPDLYAAFGATLAGLVVWTGATRLSPEPDHDPATDAASVHESIAMRTAAIWGALGAAALALAVLCKISNAVLIALLPAMAFAMLSARGTRAGRGPAAVFVGLIAFGGAAATAFVYQVLTHRGLWAAEALPSGGAGRFEFLNVLAVARSTRAAHNTVFYADWIHPASIKVFAAAFLIKTPLPLLAAYLLAPGAAAIAFRADPGLRRRALPPLALAVAMGLFFCFQGVYVGLRSLLAPMTLFCVAGGALVRAAERISHLRDSESGEEKTDSALRALPGLRAGRIRTTRFLPLVLLGLTTIEMAQTFPWTLSYFNPLARRGDFAPGASAIPKLVDSDADWGQGLRELARWQRAHSPDKPIYLAYFGNARPEDHGVNYVGLPSPYSWTRESLKPAAAADLRELDGFVAVSATHMAGFYLGAAGLPTDFYSGAFRRAPDFTVAGGSILIFDQRINKL